MTARPLWHYTCSHHVAGIDTAGEVRPGFMLTDTDLPFMGQVAWFTDLAVPDRDALGLTSVLLRCDRTEHRYRVTDPAEVMPWHRYARTLSRAQREAIEAEPGSRPIHWFVATIGVPVAYAPQVSR